MIEYRISKYNPNNRVDGIYKVHEWTSICDIGVLFDDGVLTYTQYKEVEQAYIDCCIELLQKSRISELSVCSPEYYDAETRFPNILRSETDIHNIIECCLQEKCWVKLEAETFFIHFGYDFYMYIGTNLPCSIVQATAKKYNLFCERHLSPYGNRISSDI